MYGIEPLEIKVTWEGDVRRAAEAGKELASAVGFPPLHCEEIGLTLTELATNLIRHAAGGTLRISQIQSGPKTGIEIHSSDQGPGIRDIEQAITDGYSTAGGLGFGLGTVNRLMDELDFYSGADGGLHVVCRRWVRKTGPPAVGSQLGFGAATRSYRGIPENGDAFIFKRWEHYALLGVIDGLGHGPLARRASQTARQYLEHHFDQPLDHLFQGAGRACRATRGVVMALARFDLARQAVTVASVGNIEVRLIGNRERLDLIVRRGIIGLNAPNPVVTEHPWTAASLLIMHSDGLSTHWNWRDFSALEPESPTVIARRLLTRLAKIDDDATVVVAKGNA